MSTEEEKDLNKIIEKVLSFASSPELQKTGLRAAINLFYLKGHRDGYNEAMNDAQNRKDKRVVAHLN